MQALTKQSRRSLPCLDLNPTQLQQADVFLSLNTSPQTLLLIFGKIQALPVFGHLPVLGFSSQDKPQRRVPILALSGILVSSLPPFQRSCRPLFVIDRFRLCFSFEMVNFVKRSRKSSQVSWAQGVDFCQVKLFLSDDCPSQVASECRDNLPMKSSGTPHSANVVIDDLPPGFGAGGIWAKSKNESLSAIPQIGWKCPLKFIMNLNWRVVSGEESEEVVSQKLRENKVLEAVYPHPSYIPPNPLISVDVNNEFYDDSQSTAVPLTPVEDDAVDGASEFVAQKDVQISPKPLSQGLSNLESALGKLPGGGADIMAAISTALTAYLKCNKQGSLVDTNLLIKILSDPKMIEQLIRNHDGAPPQSIHDPPSPASTVSHALNPEATLPNPNAVRVSPISDGKDLSNLSKGMQSMPTAAAAFLPDLAPLYASGEVDPSAHMSYRAWDRMCAPKTAHGNPFHPQLNQLPSAQSDISALPKSTQTRESSICATETTRKTDPVRVEPVKNLDYLKNLIREHGREKNENPDNDIVLNGGHFNIGQNWIGLQNINPGEMNKRTNKPCMYFRSPRGCRNGSNCPYLHDLGVEWRTGSVFEAPSAKRMRLGSEIAGRII